MTPKPFPEPDALSQEFFDGAANSQLMIQQCSDCEANLHPGSTVCTECLSTSLNWRPASGSGTVFSFGIMHQKYHDGFANEIPYVVAVIELPEGIRINSNIVGAKASTVAVGDGVRAIFEPVSEGTWLPKFVLDT